MGFRHEEAGLDIKRVIREAHVDHQQIFQTRAVPGAWPISAGMIEKRRAV